MEERAHARSAEGCGRKLGGAYEPTVSAGLQLDYFGGRRRSSPQNASVQLQASFQKGGRKPAFGLALQGVQPRWLPYTSRLSVATASSAACVGSVTAS
jgi:hypothetical protein